MSELDLDKEVVEQITKFINNKKVGLEVVDTILTDEGFDPATDCFKTHITLRYKILVEKL